MKDGIIEDIFADDRTAKNLENFIWQTVDPSRVEEDNPFEALAGMAGSFGFGVLGDAEDEYEDCDCSEPDCDCDEEEEDYDDYEEYDDEDGESSEDENNLDDENNQDDETQEISDESMEPSEEPVEDENEKKGILSSEEISNNKDEL